MMDFTERVESLIDDMADARKDATWLRELLADNARLRAALQTIADLGSDLADAGDAQRIARKALAFTPDGGGEVMDAKRKRVIRLSILMEVERYGADESNDQYHLEESFCVENHFTAIAERIAREPGVCNCCRFATVELLPDNPEAYDPLGVSSSPFKSG